MNAREHAQHARALIDACGGPAEASRVAGVSRPLLSNYCQPHHDATPPAVLITRLEAYCGRAVYSAAMVAAVEAHGAPEQLLASVSDLDLAASELQHATIAAQADGELTPRETNELREKLLAARRAADATLAALGSDE